MSERGSGQKAKDIKMPGPGHCLYRGLMARRKKIPKKCFQLSVSKMPPDPCSEETAVHVV